MNIVKNLFLLTTLTILFSSCTQNKNSESDKSVLEQPVIAQPVLKEENKHFLMKYAGGYSINVEGIFDSESMEVYVLNENGKAKWMWIKNNNGAATVNQEKSGSWTASKGNITININGNSGEIIEEYEMRKGRFVETTLTDHYLKPIKK